MLSGPIDGNVTSKSVKRVICFVAFVFASYVQMLLRSLAPRSEMK